jgi:DNA polymerase III sliding clamp (beta) subunit (PCNA family)
MDVTVKKADLLRELQLCQGVVERKTTIPILSNLLLEAAGDSLGITATDLELGIKTGCAAKAKKEGATTVPARRLFEIVRSLPDADIRMKALENHRLELRCERSHFKLVGMAKDNFPALAEFPHTLVKIPAALLETLIAKTAFQTGQRNHGGDRRAPAGAHRSALPAEGIEGRGAGAGAQEGHERSHAAFGRGGGEGTGGIRSR